MADKIYKKLPAVLQTTTIKNFFENTVEQLFSKQDAEIVQGFIGSPSNEDVNARGQFLTEPTATKRFYALTPTVNTINSVTAKSENFYFYDEIIDTLHTYGVDTHNHNKIFSSEFLTYLPPIDIDKFLNYQEYYWIENGPNTITITPTADVVLDIDNEVIGKKEFTYGSVNLRNGMILQFSGDNCVPASRVNVEYIVQGVGTAIQLIQKDLNNITSYTKDKDYILQARGAKNQNLWSRINYWYHVNNFRDAGQDLPPRVNRANRPILEFAQELELFNHGTEFATVVDLATNAPLNQLDGSLADAQLTDENVIGKEFIFLNQSELEVGNIVHTAIEIDSNTAPQLNITDVTGTFNANIDLNWTRSKNKLGYELSSITVLDQGSSITSFQLLDLDYALLEEGDVVTTSTINIVAPVTSVLPGMAVWIPAVGTNGEYTYGIVDTVDTVNRIITTVEPITIYRNLALQTPYIAFTPIIATITSPYGSDAIVAIGSFGGLVYEALSFVLNPGAGYYTEGSIKVQQVGDPILNPSGITEENLAFVPYKIDVDKPVQVSLGSNAGKEFKWDVTGWLQCQEKLYLNQPPLFTLYDTQGTYLGDRPGNNFAGSKIFGYATEVPANAQNISRSVVEDTELGFNFIFENFKSGSEILFDNFQETIRYSDNQGEINGYYFYKMVSDDVESYETYMRTVPVKTRQSIVSSYLVNKFDIDGVQQEWYIGGVPDVDQNLNNGYDITVTVNGIKRTDWTYNLNRAGYIKFDTFNLIESDFIYITANCTTGLISERTTSKYELPLALYSNIFNEDINTISQPSYAGHFANYMQRQQGFTGEVYGINNFNDTKKDIKHATDIIVSQDDLVLGAFLLDDQPHNLVDALRFNANEYIKYKNRLINEINKYYSNEFNEDLSVEETLENIIKRVISYKVSQDVFNRTYVVPFGDIYDVQQFSIALDQTQLTLTTDLDLNKIENSVMVYRNGVLLTADVDYTFSSLTFPVTIDISTELVINDTITVKIYNVLRDSAQCPPTPSTMGLYPLFIPRIEQDTSFVTPITVLVGHDGSRTPVNNDDRDTLLLEFEKRIYNSAKKEFRKSNSLPEYNYADVRAGAFRETGYTVKEWSDILRYYFIEWSRANELDYIINEFYDQINSFTWNYNTELPGHWKGLYEYYYDTINPHTSPWEMLGFTEKPSWWDTEYALFIEDDFGLNIPYVNYGSVNTKMWKDLEEGIIRQGPRENVTNNLYLENNRFRRMGLNAVLPVGSDGNLKSPDQVMTTENVTRSISYTNTDTGNHDANFAFRTNKFYNLNGINVSWDNDNVYVQGRGIPVYSDENQPINVSGEQSLSDIPILSQDISYCVPRKPLTDLGVNVETWNDADYWDDSATWNDTSLTALGNASKMSNDAIAVLVNGLPLYNFYDENTTWESQGSWHYDNNRLGEDKSIDSEGLLHYNKITPEVAGLSSWSTTEHSPIVGWAFDGLPIYGPYGYADPLDSSSAIVRVESSWKLRRENPTFGTRPGSVGGAFSGVFVEDYYFDEDFFSETPHAADEFNAVFGVTPDSEQPFYHYVATLDNNLKPAFPYAVGGGVQTRTVEGLFFNAWSNTFRFQASNTRGIARINVLDPGGLYTQGNTSVVIEGDGSGATANVVVTDGGITSVVITNKGKDYNTATAAIVGDGVRAVIEIIIDTEDNNSNNCEVNVSATSALVSVENLTVTSNRNLDKNWKFGDGAPVEQAWKYSSGYPFAVTEALLLSKPGKFATVFSNPIKIARTPVNKRILVNIDTNKSWHFSNPSEFQIHGEIVDNVFTTNIGYTQFINSWLTFQRLDTNIDFAEKIRTLNVKLSHRMSSFIDQDTLTARTDQYSIQGSASSLIIPKDDLSVDLHSSNYKSRNFYSGVIVQRSSEGYIVTGFDKNRGYFEILESDRQGRSNRVEVGGSPAGYSQWQPNLTYNKTAIVEYQGRYFQARVRITGGETFDRDLWAPLASLPQLNAARGTRYQNTTGIVRRIYYGTEYTNIDDVYDFLISLGRFNELSGFQFGEYDISISDIRNWDYAAKQFLFWTTGNWEVGNTLELSPAATQITFESPDRGFVAKINRTDRQQFTLVTEDGSIIDASECEIVRSDRMISIKPPAGKQIYGVMLYVKEIEHVISFNNTTQFNDIIFSSLLNQRQSRIKLKTKRTKDWDGRLNASGYIVDGGELIPNPDNLAENLGRYHELGFVPVQKDVYDASRALYGYVPREYLTELDVLDDQQFDFYRGMLQSKGTQTSLTRIAKSSSILDGDITIFDEWALKIGEFGDTSNNQHVELRLEKTDLKQDPQLITLSFPEDITNVVESIEVVDARYIYTEAPAIEIAAPLSPGIQATAQSFLNTDGTLSHIEVTEPGSNYSLEGVTSNVIASDVTLYDLNSDFDYASTTSTNYVNLSVNQIDITISVNGSSSTLVSIPSANPGVVDVLPADIVSALEDAFPEELFVVARETHDLSGSVKWLFTLLATNELVIDDGNDLLLTNGTYINTQRYRLDSTVQQGSNVTVASDITVTVANVVVSDSNWDFDLGQIVSTNPSSSTPVISNTKRQQGDVDSVTYTAIFNMYGEPGSTENGQFELLPLSLQGSGTGVIFNIITVSRTNIGGAPYGSETWQVEIDITIQNPGQDYVLGDTFILRSSLSLREHQVVTVDAINNAYDLREYTLINNNASLDLGPAFATENLQIDNSGQYKFIEVYIDDQKIENFADGGTGAGTLYVIDNGGAGGTGRIQFPDISRLPIALLTYQFNPPLSEPVPNGYQRETYFSLTSANTIKVVESSTIQFNAGFTDDIAESDIRIKVTTQDGIVTRIGQVRTYEVTRDQKNDNILFVDIDNTERFLKKPTGVRTNNLWATTNAVNASGITDQAYPTVLNAGYVATGNVEYQSFDIASLPDLYDDNILIKPYSGSHIHMAKDDHNDWNVYKLLNIGSDVSFLSKNQSGNVSLYTDKSLFNFIDTNQIGQPNTGKFMDYYITLDNANVSDNVLVWSNEEVVLTESSTVEDVQAPRMVEAFIKSIGPSDLLSITSVDPIVGGYVNNLTLIPQLVSDTVIVTGSFNGRINEGDAITLLDNLGTNYSSNVSAGAATSSTDGKLTLSADNEDVLLLDPLVTAAGAGNLYVTLNVQVSDYLYGEYTANASTLTLEDKLNFELITAINGKKFAVDSVSTGSNTVTLTDPKGKDSNLADNYIFTSNLAANLETSGYTVTVYEQYTPLSGNYFIAANVTYNSFEIERPGTAPSTNVTGALLNKSRITTSAPHELFPGDIVRINTPNVSGTFSIDTVTANTMDLGARWLPGYVSESGNIVKKGIKIETVAPHGISSLYAKSDKRIAVHFVSPLYYNKVYYVDSVTPTTLIINNVWPRTDTTHVFYEEKVAQLSSSALFDKENPDYENATNIIEIVENPLLSDYQATWDSNSSILSDGMINFYGNVVIISPRALPSNTSVSTGITLVRSVKRETKFPVVTTLDHNRINMNGSEITVDSYNNLSGMNEAINRAIALRRAYTDLTQPTSAGFRLAFNMLTDPFTPVAQTSSGNKLPAAFISNYGPYVRDAETINRLGNQNAQATGELKIADTVEQIYNENFNQGPKIAGPTQGLSYTDAITGIKYNWSPSIKDYRAEYTAQQELEEQSITNTVEYPDPEGHITTIQGPAISSWSSEGILYEVPGVYGDIAYPEGSVVIYNSQYWIALIDIMLSDNTTFGSDGGNPYQDREFPDQDLIRTNINGKFVYTWRAINNSDAIKSAINEQLTLTTLPGTGTSTANIPGVKRKSYNMLEKTDLNGLLVQPSYNDPVGTVIPRYRLQPNQYKSYAIYQAVRNDNNDIYYIKLDEVSPPLTRHDFYRTINAYSNFSGYEAVDFYYTNNITLSNYLDVNQRITYNRDPLKMKQTGYVLEIGPAEPASFIGKQLLAEPFAVSGGNNTNAIENFRNLPYLEIASSDQNGSLGKATITLGNENDNANGYNSFLLWTPGLTPGKWEPSPEGPGPLNGYNGVPVSAGFGKGYYSAGDGHTDAGNYPGYTVKYDRPIPRFVYSKNYKVSPPVTNRDDTLEYIPLTNTDLGELGLRPDQIYVACFWTEPFVYTNQLVGYNNNNIDSSGKPAPIYSDYEGTVVRFKYIRITELPANAITRRLIPDTGWGGKPWSNRIVDNVGVQFTNDNENQIWDLFKPADVSAGTTTEALTTATVQNTADAPTGEQIQSSTAPETQPIFVPTTALGPVITGGVLDGLTGPCDTVQQPGDPESGIGGDCDKVPQESVQALTLTKDDMELISDPTIISDYNVYYKTVKIAGSRSPFTVFFNSGGSSIALGLTQSKNIYTPTETTVQAQFGGEQPFIKNNTGTSRAGSLQGQVFAYGDINTGVPVTNIVSNALGLITNAPLPGIQTYTAAGSEVTFPSITGSAFNLLFPDNEMAVSGIGFIREEQLICSVPGPYVTVFVATDSRASTDDFTLVLSYLKELVVTEEVAPITGECTDDVLTNSRNYSAGATVRAWSNNVTPLNGTFSTIFANSSGNPILYDFFSSISESGSVTSFVDFRSRVDNIYWTAGAADSPYANKDTYKALELQIPLGTRTGFTYDTIDNWADTPNPDVVNLTSHVDKTNNLLVSENIVNAFNTPVKAGNTNSGSTIELKGYFRAPKTGWYKFDNITNETENLSRSWIWVSSAADPSNSLTHVNSRILWKRYGVDDAKLQIDSAGNETAVAEEYFVNDGYQLTGDETQEQYINSVAYHRDNAASSHTHSQTGQTTVIFLKEGSFYFTRALATNHLVEAVMHLQYAFSDAPENLLPSSTNFTTGRLGFSGRTCAADIQDNAPPVVQDPAQPIDPVTNPAPVYDCFGTPIGQNFNLYQTSTTLAIDVSYEGESGVYSYIDINDGAVNTLDFYTNTDPNFSGTIPTSITTSIATFCTADLAACITNQLTSQYAGQSLNDQQKLAIINSCSNVTQEPETPIYPADQGNDPDNAEQTQEIVFEPLIDDRQDVQRGWTGGIATSEQGQTRGYVWGNYVGYSKPQMTGYNFYPGVFKKTTVKLVQPSQNTYTTQNTIPEGQVVGPNSQRISGGAIISLAKPLTTTVPKTPTVLKRYEVQDQPWADNLTNVNSLTYNPRRIGSSINVNNSNLTNVKPNINSNDLDYNGPAFTTPDTVLQEDRSDVTRVVANQTTSLQPLQFSKVNTGIRFTKVPVIDITPLDIDANGNYLPAGTTVQAQISRPTPTASITQEDLLGTKEGEELYINGRRLVVRARTLEDLKNQINCGVFGLEAGIVNQAGQPTLVISSCTGQAWRVANGCGGGVYSQVGDFHINRGFEQSRTAVSSLTDAVVDTGQAAASTVYTKYTYVTEQTIGVAGEIIPANTYVRFGLNTGTGETGYTTNQTYVDAAGDINLVEFEGNSTGTIAPMPSTSTTSEYQTAGSGYRIGDRLRLIGGTPINSAKAPLTKICIDSAGSGYTDVTKLQVVINSNNATPGVGAAAIVTALDINGGIAEIEIVNGGTGYDINRPPLVEIIDLANPSAATRTIDSRWPGASAGGSLSVNGGDILEIDNYSSSIDGKDLYIDKRHLKATAPFTIGQRLFDGLVSPVNINSNVAWIDPQTLDNSFTGRAQITLTGVSSGSAILESIRPNSFVEIAHFPRTAFDNVATITAGSLSKLSSTMTIPGNYQSIIQPGDVITFLDQNEQLEKEDGSISLPDPRYIQLQIDSATDNGGSTDLVFTTTVDARYTFADATVGGTDRPVLIGRAIESKFFIPQPTDNNPTVTYNSGLSTLTVVIESDMFRTFPSFKNSGMFGNGFLPDVYTGIMQPDTVYVYYKKAWWTETLVNPPGGVPVLQDIVDPSVPRNSAKLSALMGTSDTYGTNLNFNDNALKAGYQGMAGPQRIAKFIVTGVDSFGAITSLRIIDRGVYKIFPSDLTRGLPLEYDYEIPGTSSGQLLNGVATVLPSQRGTTLGVSDPLWSVQYGPDHPEYKVDPYGDTSNERHPDWFRYPEFYFNGVQWVPYKGTPGEYDPSTWVIVDTRDPSTSQDISINDAWENLTAEQIERFYVTGQLLRKTYLIDDNVASTTYGKYITPRTLAGGSGARVFLTAQEIPDCSEKGTAREALGLPEIVEKVNAPLSLAKNINDAIAAAGYNPNTLNASVTPNGDLGEFGLSTSFPGIRLDSSTPGFLEKFGLPTGDYNLGMLCIESTLQDPNTTDEEAQQVINELYQSGSYGNLSTDELSSITGRSREDVKNVDVLSFACVQRISPKVPAGVNTGDLLNDNNSIFPGNNIIRLRELFKYTVSNIFGEDISLNTVSNRQDVSVNVFESRRYNNFNTLPVNFETTDAATNAVNTVLYPGQPVINTNVPSTNLPVVEKRWIDNYNGSWAYFENGVLIRQQEPLVDSRYVSSTLMYNGTTGEKFLDLYQWDPFKGVLPKFIADEVYYISEVDPVGYSSARSVFGRNNIGKTWWDTSTIRYFWYEQGSAVERRNAWGSAFPGSSITICEWIESEALPENWAGDGTPRFLDRYITERHQDPITGEFKLYYYYWVQNRSIIDDRIKRDLNRSLDTRTIARYIANPYKYGIETVSYISPSSMLIGNTGPSLNKFENRLQINFSRNLNPDGIDHTAWELAREGDKDSVIPNDLSNKLIDSLAAENAIGQVVPSPLLSDVERYGIGFRPRQTMFKNIKEARRVMVNVINRLLSDLRLETEYPEWDSTLPSVRTYIKTVDWFAVRTVDNETNENIRFNDSYKPVYKVSSVAELYRLQNVPDGSIAQVSNEQNTSVELWIYIGNKNRYKQINIKDETIQLSSALYTDDTNAIMSNEIRLLLTTLKDKVFFNTNKWNELFFEMLKYAYVEQGQLSWAFKTSYLFVKKEEEDLVKFTGFKPDNFQKVLDYMNEVKPYNAKIREYKDGKRAPLDYIGQNNISDYDKPPFVDPEANKIRVLDETIPADLELMGTNARYVDYWTAITTDNTTPIRKGKVNLTFDRTNWLPTLFGWDPATDTESIAISKNIAFLSVANAAVMADPSSNIRAIDRIFKYDSDVQAAFNTEVNTFFNDPTASANISIVGNYLLLNNMIGSNQMDTTLSLLKTKSGGDFQGETVNAYTFKEYVDNFDSITDVVTQFGFDSDPWDENTDYDNVTVTDSRNSANYGNVTSIGVGDHPWDQVKEYVIYEGIINKDIDGPVTLRRNDEVYEGFDSITFHRMLYGEEMPEELALFDPLESVVMTVVTSEFARGTTDVVAQYDVLPANIDLQHTVYNLVSTTVLDGGRGWINPTVTFYNDFTNSEPALWSATATVVPDGDGSTISAINITLGAAQIIGLQSQLNIVVSESYTQTLTAQANKRTNVLKLSNPAELIVGQSVTSVTGNILYGEIVSIDGANATISTFLEDTLLNGSTVSVSGSNFTGRSFYGITTEASVLIDKKFAEENYDPSEYTIISPTLAEFTNIDFVNAVIQAGVDPTSNTNFYGIDTVSGWDTAIENGTIGAWDLLDETIQQNIVEQVAPNSREVTHRVHMNLFGGTDYLRISSRKTSALSKDLEIWGSELFLDNVSWVQPASLDQPQALWIGDELIQYGRKIDDKVDFITRGAKGTTIQHHPAGTPVYSAYNVDLFNDLMPESAVWLEIGTRYEDVTKWDQAGDATLGNQDDNFWLQINSWDENANVLSTQSDTAVLIESGAETSNLVMTTGMFDITNKAIKIKSTISQPAVLAQSAVQYTNILQLQAPLYTSTAVVMEDVPQGNSTIRVSSPGHNVNDILIVQTASGTAGEYIGQIQSYLGEPEPGKHEYQLYTPVYQKVNELTQLWFSRYVPGMEIKRGINTLGFIGDLNYGSGNITLSNQLSGLLPTAGQTVELYWRDVAIVNETFGAGPGQIVNVVPSAAEGWQSTFNRILFNDAVTVEVEVIETGNSDVAWDSARLAGQTAQSLADRANADYSSFNSIMRFMHFGEDPTP